MRGNICRNLDSTICHLFGKLLFLWGWMTNKIRLERVSERERDRAREGDGEMEQAWVVLPVERQRENICSAALALRVSPLLRLLQLPLMRARLPHWAAHNLFEGGDASKKKQQKTEEKKRWDCPAAPVDTPELLGDPMRWWKSARVQHDDAGWWWRCWVMMRMMVLMLMVMVMMLGDDDDVDGDDAG